jgi:adenylate cyclase|tara:strand:- start:2559 stop:3029 length:471 start_codon:yes stop_codon:yes gene_type:complete
MAVEIERKFLVNMDLLPDLPVGIAIKQGYLPSSNNTVTRVRLKGECAFLTIKGENNATGTSRLEFEYAIPLADAEQLIAELCVVPTVEKVRYEIPLGSHVFELDIFNGDNQGLLVAEVELTAEDETFERPEWLALEVTGDARYYNSSLVKTPFTSW